MTPQASKSKVEKISHRSSSDISKRTQDKIFQFLNTENKKSESQSAQEEYPSVFKAVPGGESLYMRDGDEIIAHVAILDREFQHPLVRLRVGLIGSVVTHHSHRGKGLATELIQQACLELKRRGCLIALLWSDQEDFYLPLGFHRAGREQDIRFSPKLKMGHSVNVRPIDLATDSHLIWRLYQKQTFRLDRSLEEQKKLLKIPNTRVFVTEQDGKVTSYIAINKGADFTDFIHEWGGDISEVQKNIAFCQREHFSDKPLTLIAPADQDISVLKQMAEEKWDGVLGLIKVLDKNVLLSTYMNFLKTKNIEHVWSRDKGSILFSDSEFSIVTEGDVIELVFGCETRNPHPTLPFFLWGFDSI